MDPVALKTLLDSQQEAYKGSVDILVNQFNNRVAGLEGKVVEVISSLEFSQREIDDLKKEIMELKKEKEEDRKRISELVDQNKHLCDQVVSLERRCNSQEDYNRRNNLRISGVQERGEETWEQTMNIVKPLLQNRLQLPELSIERAHRLGIRQGETPRTIVVRFACFSDREAVMRNARKLKGTRVYINEDLCPASQELVKSQLPQLRQARSDGKIAFFRQAKLIIKNRPTGNQTSAERTGKDNNMVRERSTEDHSDVLVASTRDRGVDFGAFLPDLSSLRGSVAATTPTRGTENATSSSEPSRVDGPRTDTTRKAPRLRKK